MKALQQTEYGTDLSVGTQPEPAAGPGDGGPGATGEDPRTLVAPATT